jgi:anti-anti-sigma factor
VTDGACLVARIGDHAALVTVTGDVGAIEAAEIESALERASAAPVRVVVVDLTAADVVDPDVLGVLYERARLLRARDGLLALAAPEGSNVLRVLAGTGLGVAFQTYSSRRAALDDLDLDDPPAPI